ncbi:MAG: HTTM domain-containing protein [Polyangiaceae bacterium]
MIDRLARALTAPRDPSGLAIFRVLFGLIGAISAVRFLAYGWVGDMFVKPRFHFKHMGFEWVRVLPETGMYALFAALAAVSLMVAAGLFYRAAIVLFFLGFSYVQLLCVTNYLNHYYLVMLLAGLMALLPMNAAWSLDARLFPRVRRASVPAWAVYALRFQVAIVYTFAGLAKVNADWLLHGQPLGVWLSARTGTPLVGPLFALPGAAIVMSWAGCLFDLTIALWLSVRRTRLAAYGVVLVFHAHVGAVPHRDVPAHHGDGGAGVLPAFVAARSRRPRSSPVPRAGAGAEEVAEPGSAREPAPEPVPAFVAGRAWWHVPAFVAFSGYALFQVLFPLRAHLYGGDVHWHERGCAGRGA